MEHGLVCPNCGSHIHPRPGTSFDLTRVERITLDAIVTLVARQGRFPTYLEVSVATGRTSKGQAHALCRSLRTKGYLIDPAFGKRFAIAPSQKAWALYAATTERTAHVE